MDQDRAPKATAILTKYHAGPEYQSASTSPLVSFKISEIIQTINLEKAANNTGWSALLATPGNRKRTLIAVCLGAFTQWNGIGVVSYYLTLVLDTDGITDSFDQTLINGLLQIFKLLSQRRFSLIDLVVEHCSSGVASAC